MQPAIDCNQTPRLTNIINEREASREQMSGRIQMLTLEPLKIYGNICRSVMTEVKDHRTAVDTEKKKRHAAGTHPLEPVVYPAQRMPH
jgi:hypothetical protein